MKWRFVHTVDLTATGTPGGFSKEERPRRTPGKRVGRESAVLTCPFTWACGHLPASGFPSGAHRGGQLPGPHLGCCLHPRAERTACFRTQQPSTQPPSGQELGVPETPVCRVWHFHARGAGDPATSICSEPRPALPWMQSQRSLVNSI